MSASHLRQPPQKKPGLELRLCAAKLLAVVLDKKTPAAGLMDGEFGHPHYLKLEPRDRALCRAVVMGTLRHLGQIEQILSKFLEKPLPKNATALKHLLAVAITQIVYLDVGTHAAIDLAVQAAKYDTRTRRFAPLVNAVLRAISRQKTTDGFERAPQDFSEIEKTVPLWYAQGLINDYGEEEALKIIAAQRNLGAIDITTSARPDFWAKALDGVLLKNGSIRLKPFKGQITELPGFESGEWWVQNVAASLPALLFHDIRGKKLADLCAAPGGKSAQLAAKGADVSAFDISKNRLKRLKQNMARLNLKVHCVEADIQHYVPEQLFDGVLLDAPCSATGTIQRHPDILWIKNRQDIETLAALQYDLLKAAVNWLKPGGQLVFANCSLAKIEGEAVVARFLETCKDVRLDPILPTELEGFTQCLTAEGYLRALPQHLNLEPPLPSYMDGFFATRFIKL